MGWSNKTPMTPRQVAQNVEGSDGRTRVLAAAIDADEHQLGEYHIYELVSDLGDDEIDDLMEELVGEPSCGASGNSGTLH